MKRLLTIPIALIALCFPGCDNASKPVTPEKPVVPQTSALDADSNGIEDVVTEPAGEAETFFTVDVYDPQRDAAKDLENTIELASKSSKRILLEVGGKW